jgi:sporadic carbohydrate cluster 2OG-Fe(II) oxygenase
MNSFISPEEREIEERFMRDGFIVARSQSPGDLQRLKDLVFSVGPLDDYDDLNAIKMRVMATLNGEDWTRLAYFSLARDLLYTLVGNELCMQKKFNLNIQLPGDRSSLLPVHADPWTGDSPYQLVLWVPLTDCTRTKSMYFLPPGENFDLAGKSSEEVFQQIKHRVKYLEVKYGEILIFNPTRPHGNRVNEESSARYSLNCRFKSVWSPWGVKTLGEHFEPITLRAASRIGMAYQHPAV